MLRLTRTAIGLLTRQYRSVLKKCLLINFGIFTLIYSKNVEAYSWANLVAYTGNYRSDELMFEHSGSVQNYGWQGQYFDFEKWALEVMNGTFDSNTTYSAGTGLSLSGTTFYIANGAVTDDKIASGITASKIAQNASYRFVTDTERSTWNGYSTTIAGKADKATTLSGYGIADAYTKSEVDNLISQAGGSSVDLSDYYTKSEVYNKTEIDDIQSLNNYYRKNKKSGILNGFEAGKIGNEIGDNFSKSVQNIKAVNDNFATVENKVA